MDFLHYFKSPRQTFASGLLEFLANSTGLRKLLRFLLPGPPSLVSDIRDVVYLNWRVPAERVLDCLPPPLRLDVQDGLVWVSVLIFRHGNFAPGFLGPLRRFFPSPLQSNWRLYLAPGRDSVYFLKTATDSPWNVVGSRLFSDGLPSHLPRAMTLDRLGDGFSICIDPGQGSAPDLRVNLQDRTERDPRWERWAAYLIEKNSALGVVEGRVRRTEISIPVDLQDARELKVVDFKSEFLEPIIRGAEVWAFWIPEVRFRYRGEKWLKGGK